MYGSQSSHFPFSRSFCLKLHGSGEHCLQFSVALENLGHFSNDASIRSLAVLSPQDGTTHSFPFSAAVSYGPQKAQVPSRVNI
jgi:hypothetical protein